MKTPRRKHLGKAGRKTTRKPAKVTRHESVLKNHGTGTSASAQANKAARARRIAG